LYERALQLHPNYSYLLKTYPTFLRDARGNVAKAEELERHLEALTAKSQ